MEYTKDYQIRFADQFISEMNSFLTALSTILNLCRTEVGTYSLLDVRAQVRDRILNAAFQSRQSSFSLRFFHFAKSYSMLTLKITKRYEK